MECVKSTYRALVILALVAFIGGCDDDGEPEYEATVIWKIGNTPTCSSPPNSDQGGLIITFDEIEITVFENEQDAADYNNAQIPTAEKPTPVLSGVKVTCGVKQYEIQNLKRGSYYVVIKAWSTLEGETFALPYYIGGDKLVVPSDDPLGIDLELNKGSLEVGWGFEKGSCSHDWNAVDSIIVTVSSGVDVFKSDQIKCDLNQHLFPDLPWGLYEAIVEGFDINGALTHRGKYEAPLSQPPAGEPATLPTDTAEIDGGVMGPDTAVYSDTDTGLTSPTNGDKLDVRPGRNITAFDAYIVLLPVVE